MELRTYTGLWQVEKRLYKLYDISLPYPVSVKQIGIFIASAVPWMTLMAILRVPFENPWFGLWLVPPVMFVFYANRPVAEGKTIIDFLASQIRYYLGHRSYAALVPVEEKPKTHYWQAYAWRRTTSDTPKSLRRKSRKR